MIYVRPLKDYNMAKVIATKEVDHDKQRRDLGKS